jgi:hypothetical protein
MSTDGGVDEGVGNGVRILSLGMHIVLSQDTSDNADGLIKTMEVLEPILSS